jgi:hypothetical protein
MTLSTDTAPEILKQDKLGRVGDGSKVEFSPVQKWTIFTS